MFLLPFNFLSKYSVSHSNPGTVCVCAALVAPARFGLPDIPQEDIHLILEYDKGDEWGGVRAERANR